MAKLLEPHSPPAGHVISAAGMLDPATGSVLSQALASGAQLPPPVEPPLEVPALEVPALEVVPAAEVVPPSELVPAAEVVPPSELVPPLAPLPWVVPAAAPLLFELFFRSGSS